MSKTVFLGLLAGVALAVSPAAALADPDDGGEGRTYPCGNGQFWYPQFNQCAVMCKPGFDHLNGPEACDKIPVAYQEPQQKDEALRAPVGA